MAASRHTVENVINALIRGQAFIAPAELYVSLHTGVPGEQGDNEVTQAEWPSYARQDSLQGMTMADAWSAPNANGVSFNQNQLLFPVFNGPDDIIITHFGIWSADTAGTFLVSGALATPRDIGESQVFVADTNKLGILVE